MYDVDGFLLVRDLISMTDCVFENFVIRGTSGDSNSALIKVYLVLEMEHVQFRDMIDSHSNDALTKDTIENLDFPNLIYSAYTFDVNQDIGLVGYITVSHVEFYHIRAFKQILASESSMVFDHLWSVRLIF